MARPIEALNAFSLHGSPFALSDTRDRRWRAVVVLARYRRLGRLKQPGTAEAAGSSMPGRISAIDSEARMTVRSNDRELTRPALFRDAPDMHVLLLNNYEMDAVFAEWRQGLCPAHHLWGASHLSVFGIEVAIPPFERFRLLNRHWRVQRALKFNSRKMIALDQQIRALCHLRVDTIYSACQDHTFLLAKLRRLGLLRKKLVTTIHHPIEPDSDEERLLGAHDLVLCLSRSLRDKLLERNVIAPEKIVVIEWAPDLDFYGPFVDYELSGPHERPVLVSAGKSSRDYDTLIEGVRGLACRLEVYCSEDSAPSVHCDSLGQLRLAVGERGSNAISHVDMRAAYAKAYAIAIPMPAVDRLAGLTSLLDAMAVGRPIIMTRNRYIDIDIEREGFGVWVEPGDSKGWRDAVSRLIMDPQRAREMGRRARQTAERRYNLAAYTESLAHALRAMRTGTLSRT